MIDCAVIEQMDGSKLVKLSYPGKPTSETKPSSYAKQQILVFASAVLVFAALIISVLISSHLLEFVENAKLPTLEEDTLATAYWEIIEVKQSAVQAGTFDIKLKSSIGNLRTYEGIRSYGLSPQRDMLASAAGENLEIIDLNANTKAEYKSPYAMSDNVGEVISWSHDDNLIAVPTIKDDQTTHILVFKADGTLRSDISAKLPVKSSAGANVVYPVQFSPRVNVILARTYLADPAVASTSQMPVTFNIFNLDGKSVWEVDVRGSATDGSDILFGWDSDGRSILYATIPANSMINFADKYLFTKLEVDLGN